MRLLLVDDDVDILEPLSLLLHNHGYVVEQVSDADKIVATATRCNPDVIILDMLISGADGTHICKSLKSNPSFAHTPIIMMSAHPAGEQLSLDAGANGFIAKPFEIEVLIQLINSQRNSSTYQ